MALGSTQHIFDLSIADVDRGEYFDGAIQVARHPSESAEYLIARVLAWALERADGIAFPPGGLSNPDEPAVWVRDLTGALRVWIDVGTPDARRLHKASKAADRVAVYCHKAPEAWLAALAAEPIHGRDRLSLHPLDRVAIGALAERLQRRTALSITRTEGELFLGTDGESWTMSVPVEGRPLRA